MRLPASFYACDCHLSRGSNEPLLNTTRIIIARLRQVQCANEH